MLSIDFEVKIMNKRILECFFLTALASISALNYKIFVLPNKFAPAGVDGICVMLEYLTKTNIGYLSLIFNVPLLVAAFLLLDKKFFFKTLVYSFSFSLASIILGQIDISRFVYYTDSGTSIVLAPLAAGVVRGILYAFTLKLEGSSGGTDIVAGIVRKYKPYYNFMSLVLYINCLIAFCSYFVYGFKAEPVICSIIYSFVTSRTTRLIEESIKSRIRFEIITKDAGSIISEISAKLNKTATVIEARGAYSGSEFDMVVCALDAKSVPKLEKILKKYPEAVCFESVITASFNAYEKK